MPQETLSIKITAKDVTTRAFRSLKQSMKSVTSTAFSLQGALVGIGAGLVAKGFLDTAKQFEKFETTLKTITGSAARARESMKWITEFTAKTPYELQQVTDGFVKMKAYGLDATKWMSSLGDTASAMGKSLDQTVEMFADAVTGEFERLKEFGVRARQEGENVTFSWSENGRDMVLSAEKTQEGISSALGQIFSRFRGGMNEMSTTWEGMISNLVDHWTMFKNAVMQAGVFTAMKAWLQELLQLINRLKAEGRLDDWATSIGTAVSELIFNLDKLVGYVRFVHEGLLGLKLVANALIYAFSELARTAVIAFTEINQPLKLMFDALVKMGAMDSNPLRDIQQGFTDFRDSAKAAMIETAKEIEAVHDRYSRAQAAFKEIGDRARETAKEMKNEATELNQFTAGAGAGGGAQTGGGGATVGGTQGTGTATGGKPASGANALKNMEAAAKRIFQEQQRLAERQAYEAEMVQSHLARRRISIIENENQKQLALLDQRHMEEINRLQELNATKAQINEAYRIQQVEKEKMLAEQERQIWNMRMAQANQVAGGLESIFSTLYDETGKSQKEFFYLSKAAALAQAIINISQGVTKALAQGGPYMGPAMAAIITAKGAIEIAKIQSQGLAEGGSIQGYSPNDRADNIPIMATANEFMQPVASVKYYGEDVMEGLRRRLIPRDAIRNMMSSFPRPQKPAYALAQGGSVPSAPGRGGEDKQPIAIFFDPSEFERYLQSSRGQNAISAIVRANYRDISGQGNY